MIASLPATLTDSTLTDQEQPVQDNQYIDQVQAIKDQIKQEQAERAQLAARATVCLHHGLIAMTRHLLDEVGDDVEKLQTVAEAMFDELSSSYAIMQAAASVAATRAIDRAAQSDDALRIELMDKVADLSAAVVSTSIQHSGVGVADENRHLVFVFNLIGNVAKTMFDSEIKPLSLRSFQSGELVTFDAGQLREIIQGLMAVYPSIAATMQEVEQGQRMMVVMTETTDREKEEIQQLHEHELASWFLHTRPEAMRLLGELATDPTVAAPVQQMADQIETIIDEVHQTAPAPSPTLPSSMSTLDEEFMSITRELNL